MPEKELIGKYIEKAKANGIQMTERDILFLWAFIRSLARRELEKAGHYEQG